MVPWVMKRKDAVDGRSTEMTFNRYYHLYREGELERDIRQAGGMVVDSGYERDNWWAIATNKSSRTDSENHIRVEPYICHSSRPFLFSLGSYLSFPFNVTSFQN